MNGVSISLKEAQCRFDDPSSSIHTKDARTFRRTRLRVFRYVFGRAHMLPRATRLGLAMRHIIQAIRYKVGATTLVKMREISSCLTIHKGERSRIGEALTRQRGFDTIFLHEAMLTHRTDSEGRLEACPTIGTFQVAEIVWSRLPALVCERAYCGAGFQSGSCGAYCGAGFQPAHETGIVSAEQSPQSCRTNGLVVEQASSLLSWHA